MMRTACMLAISAGLAVVGGSQITLAQGNNQAPGTGTIDRNQDNTHPMDRGVIRPPDHTTVDPNQAQVPGTRDNPNAFDRNKGLDQGGRRPERRRVDPDRGDDSPSTPR
jgi:hypothetical protein